MVPVQGPRLARVPGARYLYAGIMPFRGSEPRLLAYPFALLNKLEFHYERITVSDGKNDSRFGFAMGFGF